MSVPATIERGCEGELRAASDHLASYRASEQEQRRTADLLRVLPRGYRTVLDIGAREGYFSRLLADHFDSVTAADLELPAIDTPRVQVAVADITRLGFARRTFDVVFCAEVLEHIPKLAEACAELSRVARSHIVIGVPYEQDIRIGRTTCGHCGAVNPPWGHVNRFSRERLLALFPEFEATTISFVGEARDQTNALAVWLMDLAGNPWGTYVQQEMCGTCGHALVQANRRSFWRRGCSGLALVLQRLQTRFSRPHPNWIHIVFSRKGASS